MRDLPPLTHEYVRVNDVTLHVVLAGPEDGPPVLLLHGFPEFWYGWRNQIGPLAAAGLRVLAPDLRGYNLSDKPRGAEHYTPELLQRDIIGLLDRFGFARAAVVGHDWGGLIGWWLGMHHPDRLDRLVILNAPHPAVFRRHFFTRPQQLLRSSYLVFFQLPWAPEILLRTGDHFWLRQGLLRTSSPGAFSADDLARYQEAWSEPEALRGMLEWYRAMRKAPPGGAPGRVRPPTLMIWGERDIALRDVLAEESIALCDDGRLERLPNATHWLQHDAPDAVNALLLDFLAAGAAG